MGLNEQFENNLSLSEWGTQLLQHIDLFPLEEDRTVFTSTLGPKGIKLVSLVIELAIAQLSDILTELDVPTNELKDDTVISILKKNEILIKQYTDLVKNFIKMSSPPSGVSGATGVTGYTGSTGSTGATSGITGPT